MTAPPGELDPITAQLRSEGARLRHLTTKLVALPVVLGLAVVAGSYWLVAQTRAELAALESQLAEAADAKKELDEQIAELETRKAALADEIAARQALFDRYASRLPPEAALIDQGIGAAQAGDLEGALELYDRALEANPRNELALALQGNTLNRAGRAEEAVVSLERAVQIDPRDGEAWYQLGFARWAAGAHDSAIQAMERAFELVPSNLERAHRDPAYKPIWDHRDRTAGIESAESGREGELIQKAIDAAKDGRLDEAINGYRAALEQNPENPTVLNYLGYACYRAERYEEAAEALRRATALDGSRAEPFYNLGLALWRLGAAEAAAGAVDEAFRLEPSYEERARTDPGYRPLRDYRAERALS